MEPGKDGQQSSSGRKQSPLCAKGHLMGVQGLLTLLGPELLKDS